MYTHKPNRVKKGISPDISRIRRYNSDFEESSAKGEHHGHKNVGLNQSRRGQFTNKEIEYKTFDKRKFGQYPVFNNNYWWDPLLQIRLEGQLLCEWLFFRKTNPVFKTGNASYSKNILDDEDDNEDEEEDTNIEDSEDESTSVHRELDSIANFYSEKKKEEEANAYDEGETSFEEENDEENNDDLNNSYNSLPLLKKNIWRRY